MKRLIADDLVGWKDATRRKPLIVRGARQVGKTFSVTEFGREYFENVVFVDFEKNTRIRAAFDGNLDIDLIVLQLEVETRKKIRDGKTLVFFDEIQACPRALTALRYFYEERALSVRSSNVSRYRSGIRRNTGD